MWVFWLHSIITTYPKEQQMSRKISCLCGINDKMTKWQKNAKTNDVYGQRNERFAGVWHITVKKVFLFLTFLLLWKSIDLNVPRFSKPCRWELYKKSVLVCIFIITSFTWKSWLISTIFHLHINMFFWIIEVF